MDPSNAVRIVKYPQCQRIPDLSPRLGRGLRSTSKHNPHPVPAPRECREELANRVSAWTVESAWRYATSRSVRHRHVIVLLRHPRIETKRRDCCVLIGFSHRHGKKSHLTPVAVRGWRAGLWRTANAHAERGNAGDDGAVTGTQ